jgi:hypothetical protein
MAIETNGTTNSISSRRLWFGSIASAIAWVCLGCVDILINWRACMHQEQYGIAHPHPAARLFIGLAALILLVIAMSGGFVSYGNWRLLSSEPLLGGEAVQRQHFMALLGVIVAVTMGVGIVWLAIPPLFLDICWRAR